jgi:hypothetical protein
MFAFHSCESTPNVRQGERLRITVENRDYHYLSQVETVLNRCWALNIPIGTRADFATKKNSKRKKLRTKKFLSLTGTTFCPCRELPPQPLPE